MCAFSKIFLQQTITATIKHTKIAQAATCSFEAKIASSGYHVFENTTWVNAREGGEVQVEIKTNKNSIKVDFYVCVILVKG